MVPPTFHTSSLIAVVVWVVNSYGWVCLLWPITTTTCMALQLRARDHENSNRAVLPTTSTTPLIGILAQPLTKKDRRDNDDGDNDDNDGAKATTEAAQDEQYIAASYVKWIEAGGARSIPIPYDAGPDLLDDLFAQINGLLLPGGDSQYPASVAYLLNRANASNQAGLYFPVWGTCLGFEFMLQWGSGREHGGDSPDPDPPVLETGYDAENISWPLYEIKPTGLYADPTIYQIVTMQNVTMNNHLLGISPQRFSEEFHDTLAQVWQITSTNDDRTGRPFVSTIEPLHPYEYPFYGIQYHPEKNAFEYATYPGTNIPYEAINHSDAAVYFALYMARFFVRLARMGQSVNQFHDYRKPDLYPIVYTYPIRVGTIFEEIYVVPSAAHWSNNGTNASTNRWGSGGRYSSSTRWTRVHK